MFTKTDYDKLKQLTADSPRLQELIEKLLASHRESLRTITHEIRNPLTTIFSELQLIETAHPEVHSYKHWDALHQDILYLIRLLNDLSDYDHGHAVTPVPLDPDSFLKQTVLSFAAFIVDSPVEFSSYIAPNLPQICADPTKLRSVLINLLKNAFEAFSPGMSGRISLLADQVFTDPETGSYSNTGSDSAPISLLRIRITDQGCGIPEAQLKDIFHPFVTHKQNGTGLGLALVKRIIEAHNGTVLVESTEGLGTTFTLLLPCSVSGTEEPKERTR